MTYWREEKNNSLTELNMMMVFVEQPWRCHDLALGFRCHILIRPAATGGDGDFLRQKTRPILKRA